MIRRKKDGKGRNNINKKDHQLKSNATDTITDKTTNQSFRDVDKNIPY